MAEGEQPLATVEVRRSTPRQRNWCPCRPPRNPKKTLLFVSKRATDFDSHRMRRTSSGRELHPLESSTFPRGTVTSTTQWSAFSNTSFDRSAFIRPQYPRRIRTEGWLPRLQRSCGDVVGRIRFPNFRLFAPDDLESVAIVDVRLRHHSCDSLVARQLRKRAGVARLWVRSRELRFRFGNRPYSDNRGIDVSEHH